MQPLLGFEGFDLAHLVASQARIRGGHPFLVWAPFEGEGRTWSYAAFADAVAQSAGGMARRGVRPGDRVLIHLDNAPEGVIAWFACAWLGATAVVTNARASAEELAYFAGHAAVTAAVTEPKLLPAVEAACGDLRWIAVTATDGGAGAAPVPSAPGRLSFEALLDDGEPQALRPPDPLCSLGVQYTSGTTSRPKGVVFTHANGVWAAKVGAQHAGLRDTDVCLVHLPLYHVVALSYSLLATLWAGGTAVLVPRFSASRFWEVSVRHRCTWTAMVPFCVRALADIEVPPVHHYRGWGNAFWSGELEARYRLSVMGWWGMTEMITHPIVGDPGKPGRDGAIGRPAPEYDVAILGEDGRLVGPGETGDLLVRGVRGLSIFKEYLDDPDATRASFDEHGYFKTGDRVTLRADGFIRFCERAKDVLKVGGENVGASEIERVVMEVPGVREAAVVGRPDAMRGEVPVAFVLTTPGVDATPELRDVILAACRRRLSDFKVPREVIVLDELPRSTIEKVSKVELRRRLQAGDSERS